MIELSVVIPAFNAEGTIAAAVESARHAGAQEILVVDDGSIDSSASIASDSGARVVVQENQGAARARLAGLRLASGKFVVFLDSDDELVADGVRDSLRVLRAATNVVGAISATRIIAPHQSDATMRAWPEGVSLASLLERGHAPAPPAAILWRADSLRTSVAGDPEPLNPHYAEDYEILLRAALRGEIEQHRAIGCKYRVSGGKSATAPGRSQEDAERLRRYYAKHAGVEIRERGPRQIKAATNRRNAMEWALVGKPWRSRGALLMSALLDPRWAVSALRRRLRR